jgi:hypothetical protein
MKNHAKSLKQIAEILALLLFLCSHSAAQTDSAAQSAYDQLVVTASSLLKQGKLDEAKQAAQQAAHAKAAGYTVVLDASGQNANIAPFVYNSSGVNDLTDALVKELNTTAPGGSLGSKQKAPRPHQ